MNRAFKSLTTIVAWLLFVFGAVVVVGWVLTIIPGFPFNVYFHYFLFGLGSLFLSVVAMKIRLSME